MAITRTVERPWAAPIARLAEALEAPRMAALRRSRPLCACGALLDDEEALLDHQAWCTGDAEANVRLVARVRASGQPVTYEALVAARR